MKLGEQNILFIARATEHGGTENVILQLCEILKPCVNNVVVCAADGFNKKALFDMGVKFYTIPDIEDKSISTIFVVCKAIKKIVKEEKITIIHTHHRMAAFYVSLLGLYKQCVFFNTCHSVFINRRVSTYFAYRRAHLIACGSGVKDNLVDYFGLRPDRIQVIHNAVKPFDEAIIPDELLFSLHEQEYFLVGSIGRLSKEKGVDDFICAMPDVLRDCPTTRFIIVGSGDKEEYLKQMVKELHLDDKVFFLGYRTDSRNIMNQLDLIVLSSHTEGLPLTPIEAFSVGKTIVATDVNGTSEIVKDGENGFLVKDRSPKILAEQISRLIKDDALRESFQQNAVQTYKNKYSFEQFAEKMLCCYQSTLSR